MTKTFIRGYCQFKFLKFICYIILKEEPKTEEHEHSRYNTSY